MRRTRYSKSLAMQQPENIPPVPLTIEGAAVLHQMMRVRWAPWRALPANDRAAILDEAAATLTAIEKQNSAAFGLLGHKGRPDAGPFSRRLRPARRDPDVPGAPAPLGLPGADQFLSFCSRAGIYESTGKAYAELAEKGIAPHSARMERPDRADAGAPAPGHAPAPISRCAAREVSVLLSDGSPPWRRQELVSASPWQSGSARWPSTAPWAAAMPER